MSLPLFFFDTTRVRVGVRVRVRVWIRVWIRVGVRVWVRVRVRVRVWIRVWISVGVRVWVRVEGWIRVRVRVRVRVRFRVRVRAASARLFFTEIASLETSSRPYLLKYTVPPLTRTRLFGSPLQTRNGSSVGAIFHGILFVLPSSHMKRSLTNMKRFCIFLGGGYSRNNLFFVFRFFLVE